MEKQTMGSLMAALRKAKGMTQQEVADRLAVSNKTVSKWERGEGCPDISMLPAIAELYEITVDELLRGAVNTEERPQTAAAQQKTEQQRRFLLESARLRFRNLSIVSLCIGVLSPAAVIVIGYSFYRCYLALGAALAFALAALIVQAVAVNKYLFTLKSAAETGEPLQPHYKTLRTCVTLTGAAVLLGLTLGVSGLFGCDGYAFANGVIESPWPYLVWLVLSAAWFGILTGLLRGHLETAPKSPWFSKRTKWIIAVGLVAVTVAAAGVPYLYSVLAYRKVYTFENDQQRAAFARWMEGMPILLQVNEKEKTLYSYGGTSLTVDDFFAEDNAEAASQAEGEIGTYICPAHALKPALQTPGFETSNIMVYELASTADLQAFVRGRFVRYAELQGVPVAEMIEITRWNDTDVRYDTYSASYVLPNRMLIFAAAAAAVWCAAWLIAGLVKRKKAAKTA